MEVILKEKIRNLGDLGEKVNVNPGYARNFLIPTGKALQATADNLKVFEAQRAELEKRASDILKTAQEKATKLEKVAVTVTAKAGEGGKLFGSIGTREIADHITNAGVDVAKHDVRMPLGVIREIGEYEIAIHLHSDVEATIKVTVVAD